MILNKKILSASAVALALLATTAQAETDAAVLERLKPVSVVCIKDHGCDAFAAKAIASVEIEETEPAATEATDTEAAAEAAADTAVEEAVEAAETTQTRPDTVAEAAPAAGRSGEEVYKAHCTVCHAVGIAGAPLTGDTAAWQARYDAEGGMDALLEISKAGKGGMPPMGTCFNCTDDEMVNSIKFMSGL